MFDCEEGEGEITSKTLMVDDFSEISLNGSMNVIVRNGKTQEVVVTGHPNIIEKLETDVRGSMWNVELESGCYTDYKLEVEIVIPELDKVLINGSGAVAVDNFRDQSGDLELAIHGSGDIDLKSFRGIDDLHLSINGSGDINIYRMSDLDDLDAHIHGSGDITFGKPFDVKHAAYHIHGSGDIEAFSAHSMDCQANTHGSGDIQTTTHGTLEAHLNGSGDVYFRGNGQVQEHVSGSGKVINEN